MREHARPGLDPIESLTRSIDEAVELLRHARYPQLQQHLPRIEKQAAGMQALQQALANGSPAPQGAGESCERLGRRLHVLSEVARQVAQVEFALTQLVTTPRESAYRRDGQCGLDAPPRFQQEA